MKNLETGAVLFFSDYFRVNPEIIEEYGAFNISLVSDLPLFIDPFLLFNSSENKYQELHNEIIKYLRFLKDKSANLNLNESHLSLWYKFPEVKQTWLGFSGVGNAGSGLGKKFAITLNKNLCNIFNSFGSEQISNGSHLEKLCLISDGVGKDSISDFTTNLIKGFLAEYTEKFAQIYIKKEFRHKISIDKAYFNYETETWAAKVYELPVYDYDYVLLTPKNILTKDENWINKRELVDNFYSIPNSIPNKDLRAAINNYFYGLLPEEPTKDQEKAAIKKTILEFKELIDYYIKFKEDRGEQAVNMSSKKVSISEEVYIQAFKQLIVKLLSETEFSDISGNSYQESLKKVHFLKQVVENNGGYRIFYDLSGTLRKIKEEDVQILYKLTWNSAKYDVNREANNGFGPVDFKISNGSKDKTLIEFKLAKNTQLKRNLQNQLEKYAKAEETSKTIKVIFFFSEEEESRVLKILKDLGIKNKENVILVDARNDNKISASKE